MLQVEIADSIDVFVARLERDWPKVENFGGLALVHSSDGVDHRWEVTFEGLPVGSICADKTGTERVQVRAWQRIAVKWDGEYRGFVRQFAAWIQWRFGDSAVIVQDVDAPASGDFPGKTRTVQEDQAPQAGTAVVPKRQDVADRVAQAHKLLKAGSTASTVFRDLVHVEKDTYRRYCRGVTGEDPLA